MSATRTWTLGSNKPAPGPAEVAFTASTPTEKPVGGRDVVYVVTMHPPETLLYVEWRLNGRVVPMSNSTRSFPLAEQKLPPGTHKLTATVTDPRGRRDVSQTREWAIDNTPPTVEYTLSPSVASATAPDGTVHYFMRDQFTMRLDARDDQPGYVVGEFRVNGDGWHHYYGWPDAPAGTPYRFTPRGTTIKELVYGSLSREGLSPQPWEPREPGWGTHRIEYRGIDAAGNIGAAKAFRVTLMPALECTRTITGRHDGDLRVDSGVTCIEGAIVGGRVVVTPGASIVANKAKVRGSVSVDGAANVELIATTIDGPVRIAGTTGSVSVFGATITGDVTLSNNRTSSPVLVAGSTIGGRVSCAGNTVAPIDGGIANTLAAPGAVLCK